MATAPAAFVTATTSGLKTGLTTNLAPADTTSLAVPLSVTVPAPTRTSGGAVFTSAAITSTAPGTVIVISIHFTPPSRIAMTTFERRSGSFILMTATTPEERSESSVSFFVI